MSYSRWKDERYYPAFRNAFRREHPHSTDEGLDKARDFNFQRYHFQGIGRYPPEAAYARGLADLGVLSRLIPSSGYVHGDRPTSIDAEISGFIANIHSTTSTRHSSNASHRIKSSAPLRGNSCVSHEVVRSRWSAWTTRCG